MRQLPNKTPKAEDIIYIDTPLNSFAFQLFVGEIPAGRGKRGTVYAPLFDRLRRTGEYTVIDKRDVHSLKSAFNTYAHACEMEVRMVTRKKGADQYRIWVEELVEELI